MSRRQARDERRYGVSVRSVPAKFRSTSRAVTTAHGLGQCTGRHHQRHGCAAEASVAYPSPRSRVHGTRNVAATWLLNRQHRTTATGLRFTAHRVSNLRASYDIDVFSPDVAPADGAPWRIRLNDQLRAKVAEDAPEGWVGLDQAATILGVARQTVLHRVQRGELNAVYVRRDKREGLRIQVEADQPGLFATPD